MIGNTKIKYRKTSITNVIHTDNWTAIGATIYNNTNSAAILTGGLIETSYSGKGLKPCKYKKYVIEFVYNGTFDDSFRYENLIQLEERVNYNMGEDTNRDGFNIIPISDYKLKTKNGHSVLTIQTEVLDNKLTAGKCIIKNRSNSTITIYNVGVYRSKDVTGQEADPSEYIEPEGGIGFDYDSTTDMASLYYMVPVMTLAEWNAAAKDTFNEAIITGN